MSSAPAEDIDDEHAAHAARAWYVLQTQRHRERAAQLHLGHAGLTTYVPLLRSWPPPAVGSDVGPMFPGYVFVLRAPADVHRIARTPGVRGFVAFGGQPACLDDAVVAFLRSREGRDGIIGTEPLPPGAEVRIVDGPLRGVVAILEQRLTARQRVLVLLEILHRRTRVELPERWVRLP
jgi:transcriptional antiterminator RfaH